jgi:peptidyl-prolyl cis-trans isomerase C
LHLQILTRKKNKLKKIRGNIINEIITFKKAAIQHSECPSAMYDGSLGSFQKGQMVEEFEEAAFKQKISAIGDIIETQFRYHIIKVYDKTSSKVFTFEQIINSLFIQKKKQAISDYKKNLRKSARIEYIN